MEISFTPSEAAAFVQLPAKRIYKELEYKVIPSVPLAPRLTFAALIYLRALKEVNFTFSIDYRMRLYQQLVLEFAHLYMRAYPSVGRPKKH